MTLILTELSEFGIAMAADSAVTVPAKWPDGEIRYRAYTGAVKLRPVLELNAGISVWGMGKIGDFDTDIWLGDFVRRKGSKVTSLRDFAQALQDELRNILGETDKRLGFHLAGYVHVGKEMRPTFYHIHNGPSERVKDIDPRKFNANLDFPPNPIPPGGGYLTRNGDYQLYARLFELVDGFFRSLQNEDIFIPYPPSLEARAEYLRFQIKTVSEIYNLSNLLPGIGGDVKTLTILPAGITSYETK